jgi:Zn ribbon nucleic-acid-binding protein
VHEAGTGRSRVDPRPDAMVVASLACPACRKLAEYQFSTEAALHRFGCVHCRQPFTAYFAEVRRVETRLQGKRRGYVFKVEELSGAQTRVEFDDWSPEALTASPGDLVAFLYAPEATLRGVLNLNLSRVLWLGTGGPCFVATVAFGEGAPELEVLRRFRDTRLLPCGPGRRLVRWYYRHGPALARGVAAAPRLRAATRWTLARVVAHLEHPRG